MKVMRWTVQSLLTILLALVVASPAGAQSRTAVQATMQNTSTTGDGTDLDVEGFNSASMTVTISATGTVEFKASADGSPFVSRTCVPISSTSGTLITSTTSSVTVQCNVAGLTRLRASVSANSGTITVTGLPSMGNVGGGGGGGGEVTNAGTFVVQENGAALTALQLIDDVVHASDAAVNKAALIGCQFDDTTPGTTTENSVRPARCSTRRELYGQIRDAAGNERGANVNASNELLTNANTELPAAAQSTTNNQTAPTAPFVNAYIHCQDSGAVTISPCAASANVAHDASAASANPLLIGGYASAAAPTDVSADTDAVRAWHLRNGAYATNPTFSGVLATTGAGNTGTGVQRVIEATDSQLSAGVGATGDAAATAGSTGSVNAKLRLMSSQLDAIQTAVQLIDDDQTGASLNHHISVGITEDETEIKATAGRLLGIHITNTNAAVRYFRCANLTAANTTPGTSTVFYGIAVPGATTGGGFIAPIPAGGIAFSTALTCWVVTGAAESDVAEVAANEINWNVIYK